MRKKPLRQRVYRIVFLLIIAIVVLIIFIARLCFLQIFQYERWSQMSTKNHQSKRVLEVKRGNISDRFGNELAISVETYHVYLYTKEIKNLDKRF